MKRHDYLYIGDGFDNTVKTFDAESGRFLGRFVPLVFLNTGRIPTALKVPGMFNCV